MEHIALKIKLAKRKVTNMDLIMSFKGTCSNYNEQMIICIMKIPQKNLGKVAPRKQLL